MKTYSLPFRMLWPKNRQINDRQRTPNSPESKTAFAFGITDFEGRGTQRGAKQTAEEEPGPRGHTGPQQ